jgi:hypothetical protein
VHLPFFRAYLAWHPVHTPLLLILMQLRYCIEHVPVLLSSTAPGRHWKHLLFLKIRHPVKVLWQIFQTVSKVGLQTKQLSDWSYVAQFAIVVSGMQRDVYIWVYASLQAKQ